LNIKLVNWPGLACAVTATTLILLSFLYASPWWQAEVGDDVARANLSPLDYNADLIGTSIEIPILWFINLSCKLAFIACAVAFFVYSLAPRKSYSKNLLNFAYKKPIIIFILFVVMLVVASYIIGNFTGIGVPLYGASALSMSVGGVTANIPISTSFTWVFWLAAATAVLALVAKIYDWKVISPAFPTTPSIQEPRETKAPETKKPETKKSSAKK